MIPLIRRTNGMMAILGMIGLSVVILGAGMTQSFFARKAIRAELKRASEVEGFYTSEMAALHAYQLEKAGVTPTGTIDSLGRYPVKFTALSASAASLPKGSNGRDVASFQATNAVAPATGPVRRLAEGKLRIFPRQITGDGNRCGEISFGSDPDTYKVCLTDLAPPIPTFVDLKYAGDDGPITFYQGNTPSVQWTSNNVNNCILSPPGASVANQGSYMGVPLMADTTYQIHCNSPRGMVSDSIVFRVIIPPPPTLTVEMWASTTDIPREDDLIQVIENTPVTVSWRVTGDVTSCGISTDLGPPTTPTGSAVVVGLGMTTYSISCVGPGGSANDYVQVLGVAPTKPPTTTVGLLGREITGSAGGNWASEVRIGSFPLYRRPPSAPPNEIRSWFGLRSFAWGSNNTIFISQGLDDVMDGYPIELSATMDGGLVDPDKCKLTANFPQVTGIDKGAIFTAQISPFHDTTFTLACTVGGKTTSETVVFRVPPFNLSAKVWTDSPVVCPSNGGATCRANSSTRTLDIHWKSAGAKDCGIVAKLNQLGSGYSSSYAPKTQTLCSPQARPGSCSIEAGSAFGVSFFGYYEAQAIIECADAFERNVRDTFRVWH